MHLHLSQDCSMNSGLCKFCTYLFTSQFSFTEAVANMFGYHRPLTSKQFCHLRLSEPHSIVLQPDFEAYRLVWLVEDDFTLLRHHIVHILGHNVALSDGEFLDVVAISRLDDVDALVDDVGLDGLTRLDGEGLQREAGRRQDAHVGGVAE